MRTVVAIGGNALLPRGEPLGPVAQRERVHQTCAALCEAFAEPDQELVLVHGNGPQVGVLAAETESDAALDAPFSLEELVAETQGLIGYWLQQGLRNASHGRPAVSIVSQTLVAADDPAFVAPTKPVGPVFPRADASRLTARGWVLAPDGDGLRRVVPSPAPLGIVEIAAVEALLAAGHVVVVCGGGGVPVTRHETDLRGAAAVVDKDAVAALLAVELKADAFVILTDVDGVYDGWGTSRQRLLRRLSRSQADRLELPAGSMGPKVRAASAFASATGHPARIGSLTNLAATLSGADGTVVEGSRTP